MEENRRFINSINLNAGTDFPYLVMEIINEQSYPRNPGFQVMHWHEDIQFIYISDGEISVRTLHDTINVHSGECIFINKNVVHLVEHEGNCHYYSFVFPDYFLKFYFGSPAAGFVERITGNSQIPVYPFTRETSWCSSVVSALKELVKLEKNKTEFYVYEVLVHLTTLWLIFGKNISLTIQKTPDLLNIRMQIFLKYIEMHYAEEISLEQLAESAHVSKSECIRCFKASIHMTPYKYLTEYRLSKASELLLSTDEPIGSIALCVGFNQMSHFGKQFKEKTGYSPKDYRTYKKII